MSYRQDISRCRADAIGDMGLNGKEVETFEAKAMSAVATLRGQYAKGELPLLLLPQRRDDIPEMAEAARQLAGCPRVLCIGTGGSALGGQCLATLQAGAPWPEFGRDPVRCHFIDNVDPRNPWLAADAPDFGNVSVLAISKSGSTMETLAQVLHVWNAMSGMLGESVAAGRFVIITQPADSPLRRFAERHGIRVLDHDPNLGGRYSVLSAVGLIPAILCGHDPAAIRTGAETVLRSLLDCDTARDCAPALGAGLCLGLAEERGVWVSVLYAYADELEPFSRWYAQLWAESLGKDEWGVTPYPARGAVDQHSQLQLWLDGPRDKLVNVVTLPRAGEGARLPEVIDDPDLAYLSGKTIGDLMAAEQRATIETLAERGVPVRHFELDRLDGNALGGMFMHFMLETILAGYMLHIDPFDQPAVETGKQLARKYLSDMSRG